MKISAMRWAANRIRVFHCRPRFIPLMKFSGYHGASLPSDTTELDRYLIGKTIVRKTGRNRISGRIVETEAYPPGYPSGHSYHGPTARNRTLFLGRGFAYVYFIYGTSYMLDVTAGEPGVGAGVLLRAIEPFDGINLMKRLRKTDKLTDLARGPGRLAAALEIDWRLDAS